MAVNKVLSLSKEDYEKISNSWEESVGSFESGRNIKSKSRK